MLVGKISRKLVIVFFCFSVDIAEKFALCNTVDSDYSATDLQKIDSFEKTVNAKRARSATVASASKYRKVDKSTDVCRGCGATGHWKFDKECPKNAKDKDE